MSDYPVISAVSQTLKTLLTANITQSADSEIKNVPIELLSPRELQDKNETLAVSVWLYRVARMADMLNEPPQRIGPNLTVNVPLPLLLHYLVTPIATDPLTRHVLLGKTLQVLNDNAIVRGANLQGILQGTSEQLRVALEALSLEDLSLVWDALSEPYQLSVSYVVQKVSVDSALEPVFTSVVFEKNTQYTQIVSAS